MFSHEWIEKFDAERGIPRKSNDQYLPAYQAFWAWTSDLGQAFFYIILGFTGAFLSLFAGYLLEVRGFIWLAFWAFAFICLIASFFDAYLICWHYHLWTMSTAHGSARWARISDLVKNGLLTKFKGMPVPKGALPIAKVFGNRKIFLPKAQWLRHLVMFGPTGSGKSKTFFMDMLRSVLRNASTLVYDPKGELCEQTGGFARSVYRLDLNDPDKSDRWNFIPLCRDNPALACEIAGMMIGAENRRATTQDPFWGDAEQIALTGILLHLAAVYGDLAIPAFAADFLTAIGEREDEDAFGKAMMNSPSLYAKQAYLAFRKAPYPTRGSILIGLYNKLRSFTLAPARAVTTTPTEEEKKRGIRSIDFTTLRRKGTAIYLVVSEGAAEIYKEFISTFLGQAVLEMRLDGVTEPKNPCFVLIDEAYQLNVAEVKRISGIGRGRGVGLALGYQDLPQMYDQYGKEQANAILGTVMTKIFLPGLDDVTAEYASRQLGDTTMLAKTFQDFPGKKHDNTRYAEQKRSLMNPAEVRQIPLHKELLIVNDTTPPIRAAYPPMGVLESKYIAKSFGKPRVLHLGDIDSEYRIQTGEENSSRSRLIPENELEHIISDSVDEAFEEHMGSISDSERPGFSKPVVLSKTLETSNDSLSSNLRAVNALDDLTDEVRIKLNEQYETSLFEMNRSVI